MKTWTKADYDWAVRTNTTCQTMVSVMSNQGVCHSPFGGSPAGFRITQLRYAISG